VVGGLAVYNHRKARAEEAKNPPTGQWVSVGDTLLHYIVKGEGPAVTLIHGNLTTGADFVACGLVDRLAKRHKVYVFDRPGYGYSSRPGRLWTPGNYARLLRNALQTLGVERATVVGHSFGTLVAMALALDSPNFVERLVLLSGYFYPSLRFDVPLLGRPAIPVLGDAMCFTVSPVLLRLMQPALFRILFAPAEPTAGFNAAFQAVWR
jgi:pimeloyl-ACP methyl ester carboxylesterase